MRLLDAADVPLGRVTHTSRHSPLPPLVVLALLVGVPVVLLPKAAPVLRVLPIWAWVVASPILLLAALVTGVVVAHLLQTVLNSFRPGNWVLRTTADGVYLKLRSYNNAHFVDDSPTVVYLPYPELATAGKVVETIEPVASDDTPPKVLAYLELRTRDVDTTPLREAVERERALEGPERSFLGIRSRGRTNHAPVQVPEPGVIHVDWGGRRMLRALERDVEIVPRRDVGLGAASERAESEDAILELVERGALIEAVKLTRETYGVGMTEARAFVDSLSDRAA